MNEDELKSEVQRLRAARADAHARNFATLTCKVGLKDPDPRYSAHAVNSATKNFSVAMQPYDNGEPCNFGIAAGESDLCILDCDHGLHTIEELLAWMERNHLPATLIGISGRQGKEMGFHLFYKGAIKTTVFNIQGVSGEVKSIGGYVCGAGSRHPSGALYTYLDPDAPIAPTPDIVRNLVKPAPKPALVQEEDELVPAGNRNQRLTSLAGTLRNAGLTELGILAGLEDFARNRCANGDQYADENEAKLRDLAYRASRWAVASKGVIDFGPFGTRGRIVNRPFGS